MNTITLLYSQFVTVIRANPELGRYRKQITGTCCRPPDDGVLRRRIAAFLVHAPQFSSVLEPLTHEPPSDI